MHVSSELFGLKTNSDHTGVLFTPPYSQLVNSVTSLLRLLFRAGETPIHFLIRNVFIMGCVTLSPGCCFIVTRCHNASLAGRWYIYSGIPISRTLIFSNLPITRTKSRSLTSAKHCNFTPDFSKQFAFALEVREIAIPLYHVVLISIHSSHTYAYGRLFDP